MHWTCFLTFFATPFLCLFLSSINSTLLLTWMFQCFCVCHFRVFSDSKRSKEMYLSQSGSANIFLGRELLISIIGQYYAPRGDYNYNLLVP